MKDKPDIIFLGTPEFAVSSLDILVLEGYPVVAVVTSPDQPAGRGRQLQSSPVKDYAVEKGIRVLQPVKLKDPGFIKTLEELQADLFIVVAFRMLPETVWSMPRLGTFNLHASLLPQYRGAAPINHAIINGETVTGLTTFFLKHEIDTGEIIFQEKIPIGPDETAGELHDRIKTAGARLVLKTVKAIGSGNLSTIDQQSVIQPGVELKPAPKIYREDCHIDWNANLNDLYNKVRGLSPHPAAFTNLISPEKKSHLIKIYKTRKSFLQHALKPSSVVTDGNRELGIAARDGILYLEEVQQAGKRIMSIDEFLRGFRLNSDWKTG